MRILKISLRTVDMEIRKGEGGAVIADSVKVCDSLLSRARGLMFRRPLQNEEGYLFYFPAPTRPWIHMLFVFFPIDIVFLDEKGKVVQIVQDAHPFKVRIQPEKEIVAMLELPKGSVERAGISEGSKLIVSR